LSTKITEPLRGLQVALIARVKDLSEKCYMDCYVSYGNMQKCKGEVITSLEKSEYEDYRTIARD
ncbi:1140_t:CDS:1, partial [Paraglomus brasilianum]